MKTCMECKHYQRLPESLPRCNAPVPGWILANRLEDAYNYLPSPYIGQAFAATCQFFEKLEATEEQG